MHRVHKTISRFIVLILFGSFGFSFGFDCSFLGVRLAVPFAFARLTPFLGLARFAFFKGEMWRRSDALLDEALVLDLLLVLDHPLFLLALEGFDLLPGQRFVGHQILVDKESSPGIGGGITRLLRREMRVLPVGELLRFGYLAPETDGVDFLEPQVENTVLRHEFLNIDTVSGCELAPAAQTVDVVAESESHFAHLGVGEEIRQLLRHADMGEAEEVTALMIRYLHQRRWIMDAAFERGPGLRVHPYHFLLAQVAHGSRHILLPLNDDDLTFEHLHGVVLEQILADMMERVIHNSQFTIHNSKLGIIGVVIDGVQGFHDG